MLPKDERGGDMFTKRKRDDENFHENMRRTRGEVLFDENIEIYQSRVLSWNNPVFYLKLNLKNK